MSSQITMYVTSPAALDSQQWAWKSFHSEHSQNCSRLAPLLSCSILLALGSRTLVLAACICSSWYQLLNLLQETGLDLGRTSKCVPYSNWGLTSIYGQLPLTALRKWRQRQFWSFFCGVHETPLWPTAGTHMEAGDPSAALKTLHTATSLRASFRS